MESSSDMTMAGAAIGEFLRSFLRGKTESKWRDFDTKADYVLYLVKSHPSFCLSAREWLDLADDDFLGSNEDRVASMQEMLRLLADEKKLSRQANTFTL